MKTNRLLMAIILLATLPIVVGIVAFVVMWGIHQWNPPTWAIIVAGVGLFTGLFYLAWRSIRRLAARQFRFSMRTMLIAFAVVALLMSTLGRWWIDLLSRDRAIRTVVGTGAFIPNGRESGGRRTNALYDWIGYDPFEKEMVLDISSDEAIAFIMEHPSQFNDFIMFSFERAGTTSAGFEHAEKLNQFTKVSVGQFMSSAIDDRGLAYLRKWTRATELFFNGCPNITDTGLAHFAEMPQLTHLSFVGQAPGMSITDAGFVHVGKIKQLRYLMLQQLPQLTDAGLDQLHGLKNLEYAVIRGTGATEAGFQRLIEALPDCRFVTDVQIAGPGSVQRIVIRESSHMGQVFGEIADLDRIDEILATIESLKSGVTSEWRSDDPWPAEIVLQCIGATRVLYEVLIGDGALQQNYRTNWTKWSITPEQQRQLLDQVLPVAKGAEEK